MSTLDHRVLVGLIVVWSLLGLFVWLSVVALLAERLRRKNSPIGGENKPNASIGMNQEIGMPSETGWVFLRSTMGDFKSTWLPGDTSPPKVFQVIQPTRLPTNKKELRIVSGDTTEDHGENGRNPHNNAA